MIIMLMLEMDTFLFVLCMICSCANCGNVGCLSIVDDSPIAYNILTDIVGLLYVCQKF